MARALDIIASIITYSISGARRRNITPYVISIVGVSIDYLTIIGLSLGLHETNPLYNPMLALTIFWGMRTLLNLTTPNTRLWNGSKKILASLSFIGAFNNTLVIAGIFPRLK